MHFKNRYKNYYIVLSFYYTSLKLLDRRKKHAKTAELKYWDELGPEYMSKESTVERMVMCS